MATQGRSRGRRRAETVEEDKPTRRVRNAKHADKEAEAMKKLVPMTTKQERYMNLIECKDLVFATGYAGTSKTYIPTAIACRKWKSGDIDKIILTRPNVSNSKSLGAFKGTLVEKMTPWLGPVLGVMYEYLGKTVTDLAIETGNIEFIPMEVIKGYSLSNAFIICDEAEDLSFDDAKKLVTRQGGNSTLVLAGDITQSELKTGSGLRKLIDIASRNKNINAGMIDFNELDDIVRHPIVKEWIRAFEKEGV